MKASNQSRKPDKNKKLKNLAKRMGPDQATQVRGGAASAQAGKKGASSARKAGTIT